MSTDVFNNPSNDYVYPALSPCAGTGDDSFLEFLSDKSISIVQGTQVLAGINFADIKIPVSSYSTQKKNLESGEVSYIGGLTKGLQLRQQGFSLPSSIAQSSLDPYFMIIDLSIGFNKNFRYYNVNLEASGNFDLNIGVDTALNIELNNLDLRVESIYEPSTLIFQGTQDGYDFQITNVILTIIDASQNANSPFPALIVGGVRVPQVWNLLEDPNFSILYAKYPNSAMQGVILKGIYPVANNITQYDQWFYVNHVKDSVNIYDTVEVDNYITNLRQTINITFDPSITFGPIILDTSIDLNLFDSSNYGFTFDPSIPGNPVTNEIIDGSLSDSIFSIDCSFNNSIITYSTLSWDTSSLVTDSSIFGSLIFNSSNQDHTSILGTLISDSSLFYLDVSTSFIQRSVISQSNIQDSSLVNNSITQSDLSFDDINFSDIKYSVLYRNRIDYSVISDSSIISFSEHSMIGDSSLFRTSAIESIIFNSYTSLSNLVDSFAKDCEFENTSFIDASITGSVINLDSSVGISSIENSWINAYVLLVDASGNKLYVIDDPSLSVSFPSNRVNIHNSVLNDCSIHNTNLYNSVIYNSLLVDVSLIQCTLYNCTFDPSTITFSNTQNIRINETIDASVLYDLESSTYYTKSVKSVNVGMSGSSTSDLLSAGDYLDWVQTNGYWRRVGDIYIWTTAPDFTDTKNLINGFYVFNPHDFPIQLEYLIFV
jgi:hypothetical protein